MLSTRKEGQEAGGREGRDRQAARAGDREEGREIAQKGEEKRKNGEERKRRFSWPGKHLKPGHVTICRWEYVLSRAILPTIYSFRAVAVWPETSFTNSCG